MLLVLGILYLLPNTHRRLSNLAAKTYWKNETSDRHLQTIMKNGFPIKNFEDLIDQVWKMD